MAAGAEPAARRTPLQTLAVVRRPAPPGDAVQLEDRCTGELVRRHQNSPNCPLASSVVRASGDPLPAAGVDADGLGLALGAHLTTP